MTLGVPPLAAGFASKFDEIGPYIGFGSLVAVVAMAILVFAQGRELQRLRDWAGTSPERLDALEQEVRDRASIPPRSVAAQQAAQQRTGYVVPGAVPAAGAALPGAPPRPPGAPAAPGAAPAAPGAPGAAGVPAPPGSPVVGAAAAAAPGGPPRPTPPRPTPPGTPATRVLASSAAGGPRAATAAGAAASSRDRDRDRGADGPPRSIGQIVGVSVVGVVVLLALLFAFGVIGGGDEGPDNTPPGVEGQTPSGESTTTRATTPRYPRTEMKTLVLNASGSGGLAKDVSDSIEERFRFPMGQAANYNSIPGGTDTSAITMVFYRAGAGERVAQNKAAAQDIARFLKLSPVGRYVKRMPDSVKNGTAGQRVVLVVGADYARANPPTGTSSNGTATTPDAAGGSGTTPGSTGGTGSTDGTGGATTQPADPSGGTSQLTPNTDDLGTDPGVDDGTGGAAVP